MAKKNRTVVGSPLTPRSLYEMGALAKFPAASQPFDPEGEWVQSYRVWTNHGYTDDGLDDVGFLKIERVLESSGKNAVLKVRQQIIHDGAQLHQVDATIRCSNNSLASPEDWTLSSRFIGPDNKPKKGLEIEERGRLTKSGVEIQTGGKTFTRKGSDSLTGDWCLYDALQRLPFEKAAPLHFDVLEEMSVLREGAELSYRGVSARPGNQRGRLHCFQQLGRGILPYEYYLDPNHRLLMAITFSVAFIWDEDAEEKARKTWAAKQNYAKQRAAKRKARN